MKRVRGDELSESLQGWLASWGDFFKGDTPKASAYEPFLLQVCQRVRAARDRGESVVITQGLHRWGRDFIREHLEGVFFIGLVATQEKIGRRNFYKEARYSEIAGLDFNESFAQRGGGNKLSEATYARWFANKPIQTGVLSETGRPIRDGMATDMDEPECCNIDISRDDAVLPQIRQMLRLPPAQTAIDVQAASEANWTKMAAHEERAKVAKEDAEKEKVAEGQRVAQAQAVPRFACCAWCR